jgi:hypothetical protein
MEKQQQAIHDFLTEPVNFGTLVKVVDRFETIKSSLLEDFWQLVKSKVHATLNVDGEKWKTSVEDLTTKKEMLWLYKSNWVYDTDGDQCIVALGYCPLTLRNVGYGFYMKQNHEGWDTEAMKTYFNGKIKPKYSKMGSYNSEWMLLYSETDYDFSRNKDLIKILEVNRHTHVETLANNLIDFALSIESDLDKLSLMKKNNKKKKK